MTLIRSKQAEDTSAEDWPSRLSSEGAVFEEALKELQALLIRGVGSVLSKRGVGDDGFVEDVTQASIVRILERLHSFEGRSAFSSWAMAIALRVAFSELRRKHWNSVSLEALKERSIEPPDTEEPSPGPREQASRSSMISLMHDLIQTELTSLQRDVLVAELNAMPQDEIARQLGRSRNAIYKLGHDARRALKRAFENAGYTAEDVLGVFQESSSHRIP